AVLPEPLTASCTRQAAGPGSAEAAGRQASALTGGLRGRELARQPAVRPLDRLVAIFALAVAAPACSGDLEEQPVGDGAPPGEAADAGEPDAPPEVTLVGRWQSYFNEPGPANDYTDNTLRDRLVSYIDGAVTGSEIRAHVTNLSGAAAMRVVADALIAAHDRGVAIWMVHNGDSYVFPELHQRLGERYVHCGTPEVANNTACVSSVEDGT